MNWIYSPESWMTLATLTVLEIVRGSGNTSAFRPRQSRELVVLLVLYPHKTGLLSISKDRHLRSRCPREFLAGTAIRAR